MLVSAEDWQFGVALHQIPMHHGNGTDEELPCFWRQGLGDIEELIAKFLGHWFH